MKRLKAITKRVTSSSHDKKEASSSSSLASKSAVTSTPAASSHHQQSSSSGSKRFSITSHKDIQVIRGGYNIDLSHVDSSFTKLHRSCLLNESEEKVLKCLSSGMDPNQVDQVSGSSPIHISVVNNNIPVIRLLLQHGGEINLPDGEGKTPLIKAIQCNHEQLVKFLVFNQANGNLSDPETGNTALMWALNQAMMEAVKILLLPSSNMDVNRRNVNRETALHIITKNPSLNQFLDQVMDMNATLNVIDVNGRTPLMNAAACGNLPAVQSLVKRAVDVNVRDASGLSAIDLAKTNGYTEIAQLIEGEGANQRGKLSPASKQPILMSWTDSEDSDTEVEDNVTTRPKTAKSRTGHQEDRQSGGSFNPVIQQLQLLQGTTGFESGVQPSVVRRSLGSVSNITDDKITGNIIRNDGGSKGSSPYHEESHATSVTAGSRKISIDWASLMNTSGKNEHDPLLVSDSDDDDEEEDEEGDEEEDYEEGLTGGGGKVMEKESAVQTQEFIQNLRDLLEGEMAESSHDLDHLLAISDEGRDGKVKITANTDARAGNQSSTFSLGNPFNPFTGTIISTSNINNNINNNNDIVLTGKADNNGDAVVGSNLVSTIIGNHGMSNHGALLGNQIMSVEKGDGSKITNHKDAESDDAQQHDGGKRNSEDVVQEGEKGEGKSINQHEAGISTSVRKDGKTAFTPVAAAAAAKQDLNEVTSSVEQSESVQQTATAERKGDLDGDKKKKSGIRKAPGSGSTASIGAAAAGKHQLPPVKSLIQPALPVIINLIPGDSQIERSQDAGKEAQTMASSPPKPPPQQQSQQLPFRVTDPSADDDKQTSGKLAADQISDLHFNDHDSGKLRASPAVVVVSSSHQTDDDENDDVDVDDDDEEEEEEDEWHEMQSHENLNFNAPHVVRSSPTPDVKQSRLITQPASSITSLITKEDVKSISRVGSVSQMGTSVTTGTITTTTTSTPAALSVNTTASIGTSSSSPTGSSTTTTRLATSRESFDLNVRLKELESIYSKTKEELNKIKRTSHAFSEDYHVILKEKIGLEEKYYSLQTAHAKLTFEADRLKSEVQKLTLDHELIRIKDQEIESLRSEREEMFNEKLLLHQKINTIRDEMSHSMKVKAESLSAESDKRMSTILGENSNLVHENKELKNKLLILQAEMIRVKMDHETDITLLQKEKERLMLEAETYRLRAAANNNLVNGKQHDDQSINMELVKSVHELNNMISMMQCQQQQQFNDTIDRKSVV